MSLINDFVSCPVLRANIDLFFERHDPGNPDLGFIDFINLFLANQKSFIEPLTIYSEHVDTICNDYDIPVSSKPALEELLNQSAVLYLILHFQSFSAKPYRGWLDQIDKLGKTAAKLEKLIGDCEPVFFEKLAFFNHFEERDENEPTVSDFFNSLLEQLRILKKLKSNINESHLGKGFGLGKSSRRKNIELNFWIEALYLFWHNRLARNMKRDKTGLGGRKRFLDFMEACIIPLHPEIVADPYSPQERLDTALKSFQSSLKVHGEITSQN